MSEAITPEEALQKFADWMSPMDPAEIESVYGLTHKHAHLVLCELRQLRTALAAATKESERWSTLYSNLQDERAADFAKWFKMLNYDGLTEYQAECPQVIDEAIRQLVNWRWTTSMHLVVQAMASKPDWVVLGAADVVLGFGKTPMEAIEAAKKEVGDE